MTVDPAVSPVNSLVFQSTFIGAMNEMRQNLDPNEEVIFIYDGVPAHRNHAISAANTKLEHKLKMLPTYSPFLNYEELNS